MIYNLYFKLFLFVVFFYRLCGFIGCISMTPNARFPGKAQH
jgi:hypothetical protein